jgi:hypothetical protein
LEWQVKLIWDEEDIEQSQSIFILVVCHAALSGQLVVIFPKIQLSGPNQVPNRSEHHRQDDTRGAKLLHPTG